MVIAASKYSFANCRKFKSPVTISSVSFELHGGGDIGGNVGAYIYGQLSEVQMVRDLDLDLLSDQGHIIIHSTC